jgi:hypothetical protein
MEKVITPGAGALTHTACVFHEFCMGFAHKHSAAICLGVFLSLSRSRLSRLYQKLICFHPSSAKTHTLMRDAALMLFSAVRQSISLRGQTNTHPVHFWPSPWPDRPSAILAAPARG